MVKRFGEIRTGIDGSDEDKDGLIDEVDETREIEEDDGEDQVEQREKEDIDDCFRKIFEEKYGWSHKDAEKIKKSYLDDLYEDVPDEPRPLDTAQKREYSDAEIEQLANDDPGYKNEKAMKPLDEIDSDGAYKELGFHIKTENFGEAEVEGSVETNYQLEPGHILQRMGSENGNYLSEPDVDFEDLQLPYTEERYEKHEYMVLKPLQVDRSLIASQPFDEPSEEQQRQSETEEHGTVQYKTQKAIKDLIEQGYLKEL